MIGGVLGMVGSDDFAVGRDDVDSFVFGFQGRGEGGERAEDVCETIQNCIDSVNGVLKGSGEESYNAQSK